MNIKRVLIVNLIFMFLFATFAIAGNDDNNKKDSKSLRLTEEQEKIKNEIIDEFSKDATLLDLGEARIVKSPVRFASSPHADYSIYIPVTVSPNKAGRKPIFDFTIGEPVLMGIFITNNEIYRLIYTREDKQLYKCELKDPLGKSIISGRGKLKVNNKRFGFAEIIFYQDKVRKSTETEVVFIYKCSWWSRRTKVVYKEFTYTEE